MFYSLSCVLAVSLYFKQKLQGLYVNAQQDSKKELVYVSLYMATIYSNPVLSSAVRVISRKFFVSVFGLE